MDATRKIRGYTLKNIATCQRGGVPNEPLGQRQDTGPGILPLKISKLDNHLDKNFKRERTAHLIRPFLLRQGDLAPHNIFLVNW